MRPRRCNCGVRAPIRQPLFLAGVKLRLNSEGFSLPSLVAQTRERLKEAPVAAAKCDRLLLDAGHYDGHASQYSRRFELAELRVREVTGNFPRLTVGNVPSGVTAASSVAALSPSAGFAGDAPFGIA